ncbi:hypothetical protein RND81_13G193200 [Saponaria officinalis]|uniref:Peptidase A1 domain-containing protein n=1 Tax=Saponaria officinalis TaxID=3572 RepID=A0AAW1H381_SAPOF
MPTLILSLLILTISLLTFSSAVATLPRPLTPSVDRHPLLLPLSLSSPRISDVSKFMLRRHLHGASPNARMRLYDDLLSNGYYTTRIWIGTPPQEFALIVDTGSTVTYVPCNTCDQCGNHQDPKFQPDLSNTYHPVKCNPECTCDAENDHCTYERQYAEMSSSSGILGEDLISFGNMSELTSQRAVFGCENAETGDLYSQHADGIMGLGRGDLSIVDQLVEKGVINDSFSLCYGGMEVGGGAMVLGQISPPSDMVFSHSDPDRSPYYNIELRELHVAGKKLDINPQVFDGKHGTVLDSGTTYAYLPEAAFVAFMQAVTNELHGVKQIRGPDPNYNDICFSGAGSEVTELSRTFPSVDMVFGNGQKYSLSPENYLFKHSKVPGAYCLGVFQNGKDPTTLLGGIVVRNTLVTYDREHLKVGFWKTNCSELWERLNASSISPAPPPLGGEISDTNPGMQPASAPSGVPDLPDHVILGDFFVGYITFNISLSINFLDLKPHVSELSDSIAKELGVNVSQVNLLNTTSAGNGSLITCSIYPEGSVKYFSNTTATHIVSRLAELQLPDTFGSYKLVNWKFQPPSKRSWQQRHYLVVFMTILVILMLGLSVYGIWFVWKWRQEAAIPYKPVDSDAAPVIEQELQPL